MKILTRSAAVLATATLAVTTSGLHTAANAADTYAFAGYAGGTQITAVGLTVSSDRTAESFIAGQAAAENTNKVANINVSPLAYVGAVNTDVTAVEAGDGFKVTSHARTGRISLLNGLIRVNAVETTSITTSDGSSTPTASTDTELLGLTIAGKKYPLHLPPNTGINIPGIASITINASTTAVKDDSVVTMGAGLAITLLKQRGQVAAGAEILLNPTYAAIQPSSREGGGATLGGTGYGAFINAHVGTAVEAETGRLGAQNMPLVGTDGAVLSNTTGRVRIPGVLNLGAIESTVSGTSLPALNESTVTSKLVGLNLFPRLLFGGLITATAIGSTSHVKVDDSGEVTEGDLQFVNLQIAGQKIPINVAPNTSIDVAGLGKVTINEQKEVSVPGLLRAYQVIGLHVVLDTAKAGLPIGAEIQIGVSQALVWG